MAANALLRDVTWSGVWWPANGRCQQVAEGGGTGARGKELLVSMRGIRWPDELSASWEEFGNLRGCYAQSAGWLTAAKVHVGEKNFPVRKRFAGNLYLYRALQPRIYCCIFFCYRVCSQVFRLFVGTQKCKSHRSLTAFPVVVCPPTSNSQTLLVVSHLAAPYRAWCKSHFTGGE